MKAFVTGAGGFIGSHLCELLLERGYDVKALVRYNSRNSWGWLEQGSLNKALEIVAGDVRDFDLVRGAMKGQEMVFHLAALIGIPYSYVTQDAYVETNIRGTLNVLQAARETGVSKMVHTSTSEVYGTAQFAPITEEHPVNPQSPYAATKAGADCLALSFFYSFGTPVAILRPFNTYGPRQSARAVIPTIITQILSGERTVRLGALSSTRDFTFVRDTAEAFLKMAESAETTGKVLNAGSATEIAVGDLAAMIAGMMGAKIEIVSEKERMRPEKSEVERLLADTGRAASIMAWKPRYSLSEGLAETIAWLRENKEHYKAGLYNV
jgi:NAD dependent epimerase/dehydratase